jgi:hypothetical protein
VKLTTCFSNCRLRGIVLANARFINLRETRSAIFKPAASPVN